MLFGEKTEKTSTVIAGLKGQKRVGTEAEGRHGVARRQRKSRTGAEGRCGNAQGDPHGERSPGIGQSPRSPGHGRNGADALHRAEKIEVPHASLQPGDPCPKCEEGTVYETSRPGCWCGWWARRRWGPRCTISRSCVAISAAWSSRPSCRRAWSTEKYDATVGQHDCPAEVRDRDAFQPRGDAAREPGHSLASLDPVGHRRGPGRACRAGLRGTDPASGPRRRGSQRRHRRSRFWS